MEGLNDIDWDTNIEFLLCFIRNEMTKYNYDTLSEVSLKSEQANSQSLSIKEETIQTLHTGLFYSKIQGGKNFHLHIRIIYMYKKLLLLYNVCLTNTPRHWHSQRPYKPKLLTVWRRSNRPSRQPVKHLSPKVNLTLIDNTDKDKLYTISHSIKG